jgi:hypothetical protein
MRLRSTPALLALPWVLAACASPGRAPAAPIKIVDYYRCPYPASVGLTTIAPDGGVRLSVSEGFDPRQGRATRQKKTLSAKDLKELAALVRKSGYESIPETTYDLLRASPSRTDACSRSLEITVGDKTKRISYDNGYDNPPALDRFLKGLYAILDRHPWEPDRYAWEK